MVAAALYSKSAFPYAERIAELERENRELRRANDILKAASAFFAREICAARRRVDRGGVGDLGGAPFGPREKGGFAG